MSQLAHTLHDEHQIILDLLKSLRASGANTPEGLGKLREARTLIMSHLEKEDQHVYPVLQKHEATKDVASLYADEMLSLSSRVCDFFDHFEATPDASTFSSELGRLLAALQTRIAKEEYVLLPAYKELRLREEATTLAG